MQKTNQNLNQLIQLAIGNEYWFWLMSDWFQSDLETQFKTVVVIYSLWLRKGILLHTTCIQCMKRERSDCNNCNICTVHIGSQFAYTNTKQNEDLLISFLGAKSTSVFLYQVSQFWAFLQVNGGCQMSWVIIWKGNNPSRTFFIICSSFQNAGHQERDVFKGLVFFDWFRVPSFGTL